MTSTDSADELLVAEKNTTTALSLPPYEEWEKQNENYVSQKYKENVKFLDECAKTSSEFLRSCISSYQVESEAEKNQESPEVFESTGNHYKDAQQLLRTNDIPLPKFANSVLELACSNEKYNY